jgi:hypothetical protein
MPLLIATVMFAVLALAVQASAQEIITFDVPGAGTGAGQGTMPIGIVQGGWVMGRYIDANNVAHGFLRTPNGLITKFNVPGMGENPGQGAAEVFGMTPRLEIAGDYFDSSNNYHAFLRTRFGEINEFACPGAGPGGTAAEAVNPAELISAMYLDNNGAWHGCLRSADGSFNEYDPPDAGTGSGQGTYAAIFGGINPEGAVIGEYNDNSGAWHAYVRARNGAITEYDPPNASGAGALAINEAGEIWGWYFDGSGTWHGYLRSPDGAFTQVDAPGAGTAPGQGTTSNSTPYAFGGMNQAGTVTAPYVDSGNVMHGFQRTAAGKFTIFDVRGAGTGAWQGTMPISISPEGAITGWYIDPNNVSHGFLRMPEPRTPREDEAIRR